MICPNCREAADKKKPKLHKKCNVVGCCCQHRITTQKQSWIIQKVDSRRP